MKVISGGQTGADIAGLKAAKRLLIPTGGHIPKGFKTENGGKPEYASTYGLVETKETDYNTRTLLNIINSDFTLILANLPDSPGTNYTVKQCLIKRKPFFVYMFRDICLADGLSKVSKTKRVNIVESLANLIKYADVVNIAGNRESVSPGIEDFSEELLFHVFRKRNCL